MKKIISLILALLIVASSFSVFADEYLPDYNYVDDLFRFDVGDFAAGTVNSDNTENEDDKRIEFLSVLGIWDDASKNKEALLTKTEFSVIMSNLRLGKNNAIKSVYLLKENEDTTKVTYNDACVYLVETLGYAHRCKEYGNTENAWLVVADQIGLIDDMPESGDTYITRNELAKLIMNSFDVDMCTIEYVDGGSRYTVSEGKTILNSIHGVYNISGFVNAVEGLSVYGNADLRKGFIQINRKNVYSADFETDEFFGRGVKAYATFDENTNQYNLIYIDLSNEYEYTEINFSDISDKHSTGIVYVEDGVEKEANITSLKHIIMNGEKLSSVPEVNDFATNEGKIILTSSEKYGAVDTAIIYKYDYYVVKYNDLMLGQIGFKFFKQYNSNEYIQINESDRNVVTINGKKANVKDIPPGNSVRIFRCDSTGYTNILVSTEKVSGEVAVLDDCMVEIGGKEYRLSKDLMVHIEQIQNNSSIEYDDKIHPLEIGESRVFYLVGNVITGYEKAQDFKFGYIKSLSKSRTNIDPEVTLRVFTAMGEWKDFKVKEKIELDGRKNVTCEEFVGIVETRKYSQDDIRNSICRYKVNASEEIIALDTVYQDPYFEDSSHTDVEFCGEIDYYMNWTEWTLEPKSRHYVSSKTVFFLIPYKPDKEDKYKVALNSELPKDENTEVKMELYNANEFLHLGAVVIRGDLDITASDGEVGFYVESIRRVIINEDDQIYGYRLVGKQTVNGRQKGKGSIADSSFYVTEEEFNEKPIAVGDFVSIDFLGSTLTEWDIVLPQSIINQNYSNELKEEDDNKFNIISGKIKEVDAVEHLVLIEVNGEEFVYSPRSMGLIDKETKKMTQITISDFHKDEWVYSCGNLGSAIYLIKNK